MKQEFDRFDMKRPPVRTKWYLRPLTSILSAPDTFIHRTKISRTGTEGLKPPYLMLCNHNAFMDFKVATRTIFPHRANYVVAIDGFIGREELLRNVGCICKRKFTNDVTLIRHLRQVMRNGDVLRLKEENFIEKDGRHYLNYTPHKTELTSGRRVYWPIHEAIWRKYDGYGGLACFDITDATFAEINRDLRSLGFRGSKASYELRKICIDPIYQKFGAEMAVSISGDDIKTITHYYADPSQPNIGAIRVIDLL